MKNSLFLFFALSILLTSCAAPTPTSQFYHKHKRKEGVQNFKAPGWLVWIGTGIAHDIVKEEEVKQSLRLAKKVKKLRFMSVEEGNLSITPEEITGFVNQLRNNNFEDLISVRDGATTVNILVRDKKEKLNNLLILVNEEDGFVYLDMKTKIKYKELTEILQSYLKDMDFGEKKKKEEKKAKEPQV